VACGQRLLKKIKVRPELSSVSLWRTRCPPRFHGEYTERWLTLERSLTYAPARRSAKLSRDSRGRRHPTFCEFFQPPKYQPNPSTKLLRKSLYMEACVFLKWAPPRAVLVRARSSLTIR
jgi:hypothetical protein